MKAPAEFHDFAVHFVDLSGDRSWTLDQIFDFAIEAMDDEKRKILIAFLDQCLDGTHAETELTAIWARTSARVAIEPTSWFFGEMRDRLRASLE